MKKRRILICFIVALIFSLILSLQLPLFGDNASRPNEATQATKTMNAQPGMGPVADVNEELANALRGRIAYEPSLIIKNSGGRAVWDMNQYSFLANPAPDTAHPLLWNQAQLNCINGLFKVTDRIYQIRGYDISVISFIQGDTGWIVVDPLTTTETAKAALDFVNKNLGQRPVVAVIHTHSHADHFQGVRGVASDADISSGKIKIIAPQNFLKEATEENVIMGNVMQRRADYMYGGFLPSGPKGQIDSGLGKYLPVGTASISPPSDEIISTGQKMTIDGVDIIFQMTPGTEAPAEMTFYFPQFRALCMAELACPLLHNLLTLRGAKVRDGLAWSNYINEAIDLFGAKTDVLFGSHNWPRWGTDKICDFLKKQRDLYKYINDQAIRLANEGYNMEEISEMFQMPDSLSKEFYTQGFYGSVSHDVKAVYQRYVGWFDGNPAHLHPLPPVEAGRKYVEFMGGADAVLQKARQSFDKGEYRWVAMVVNHLVFADPSNQAAKELLASAYDQLGYQSESGPWRNFYLSGAKELREGVSKNTPHASGGDLLTNLSLDAIFQYLAVHLNGPKADGKSVTINFNFTDTSQKYVLWLENSVLHYQSDKQSGTADLTLIMTRVTFNKLLLGQATFADLVKSGDIIAIGRIAALPDLLVLMDQFDPYFNIVTP
ncbi:MAG: MBL fold metallo-hydrolase [Deltaproteobacteria bacterium]|nr:MBL fold metallo-hydrolase [Deltaproteobacteria bacterium]